MIILQYTTIANLELITTSSYLIPKRFSNFSYNTSTSEHKKRLTRLTFFYYSKEDNEFETSVSVITIIDSSYFEDFTNLDNQPQQTLEDKSV